MTSFSLQRKNNEPSLFFYNKSDLDKQINTSDRLQNEQIILSEQAKPSFRGYLSLDGSDML